MKTCRTKLGLCFHDSRKRIGQAYGTDQSALAGASIPLCVVRRMASESIIWQIIVVDGKTYREIGFTIENPGSKQTGKYFSPGEADLWQKGDHAIYS